MSRVASALAVSTEYTMLLQSVFLLFLGLFVVYKL